jgi:hypothetical protein
MSKLDEIQSEIEKLSELKAPRGIEACEKDAKALIKNLASISNGLYEIDERSLKVKTTEGGFEMAYSVVLLGEYYVFDEEELEEELTTLVKKGLKKNE